MNAYGQDPETRGVQELIISLFKVHSWLIYGWKSVRFLWHFHTFHGNGDGVLVKIRHKTPNFMYLLTNRNIAGIKFVLWPNMLLFCWLWTWSQQSLMQMVGRQKYDFGCFFFRKWQKPQKNVSKTYRPILYWIRREFLYFKNCLD